MWCWVGFRVSGVPLKNDNTKTKQKLKLKYFQKREINENENIISLTKLITKTKIESKLTLNSVNERVVNMHKSSDGIGSTKKYSTSEV